MNPHKYIHSGSSVLSYVISCHMGIPIHIILVGSCDMVTIHKASHVLYVTNHSLQSPEYVCMYIRRYHTHTTLLNTIVVHMTPIAAVTCGSSWLPDDRKVNKCTIG